MKECNKYTDLFVEYLFGEIEEESKEILLRHLARCPRCESELAEMRQTMDMMGKKSRVEPSEEYWDSYWSVLSARMDVELAPEPKRKVTILERIRALLPTVPGSAYRWAAVTAALVLGILIGRFILTTDGIKQMPVAQRPQLREEAPSAQTVDYRAEKYLEKSKIFLLGFVNTNGEIETGDYDFDRQGEVSQDLIQETSYLKENLDGRSQQRVVNLIEQLETILIEIANLEEEEDLPNIELIRNGIDRNGILLKINVHQMKDASQDGGSTSREDKTLI